MKQYITGIAVFLLCSLSVLALETSDFNPTNPPEPSTVFALALNCDSAQSGLVTGGGNYQTGEWVLLSATPNPHHVFVAWMDGDTVISNALSFYYTMPDRNVQLTVLFEYRQMYQLSLETEPSGIGELFGSGYYESGLYPYIESYGRDGYTFKGWWEEDVLVNEGRNFEYLMPDRSVKLTARYEFDPTNPDEPNYQGPKHWLYTVVEPLNGGSLGHEASLQFREGESNYLYAYNNTGFVFDGWYHKDTLFSSEYYFYYTMGVDNDTLTARFSYDPSSPAEPNPGTNAQYYLSALTQTAALGSNLAFPVYLTNENLEVYSAAFDIEFPTGVVVDYLNASLSSRRNGHTLAIDTLGDNRYHFALSNDQTLPLFGSNGSLLTIPVTLPTDWEAGSSHPVLLGTATIGTESGQIDCPVKNGAIAVTATVSDLYASFYADIHLNRARFTNMSSTEALTYLWNFGDGQSSTEKSPLHVFAGSGSYDVVLSVSDGANTDSLKMRINIAAEDTWMIEGYYTLNKNRSNVKNFTSGTDLFNTFSRGTITGDVFIQVGSGQVFDIPLDSTMEAIFGTLYSNIVYDGGPILTFLSENPDSVPLLDFSGVLYRPYVETVMETARHFWSDNVDMAFSGLKLNVASIHGLEDITICSGHSTPEVDLSEIGNQFNLEWKLINTPLYLSGQRDTGSILIPSMELWNDTTFTDTLVYSIQLISNDYVFYAREIRYVVLASLQVSPLLLSPASNAVLESPIVTFNWKYQNNALYDLYVWEVGTTMPGSPFVSGLWTGSFTDYNYCKYGKAYNWKILAKSNCDSIWSAVDSFQVGRLPDLIVESITLSKELNFAGEGVDVHVLIRNIGGRIYGNSWGDQLYLVSGENHQDRVSVASTWVRRELEADSSYQLDFHVELPLDTVDYTHFMIVADAWSSLSEASEQNNSMMSDSLHLSHYVIDDTEFETLRLLYEYTAGANWTQRWSFSTNKIVSTNWSGVDFEKGHVVSIDLDYNNLIGQLPAELFNLPYLHTLNLRSNTLSGRLEELADTMKARDYRCDSLIRLDLGDNNLNGEIATFMNLFPTLSWLNLESNRFTDIDTVLSRNISTLNLQYQTFSHPDIPLAMNPVLEIPSLFWYKHDTQEPMRKDLGFYLYKDNSYMGSIHINSNSTFVLSLYRDWIYPSGDSVELMQYNNYVYGSRATLHMTFGMGDANIDQQTDILDIQHTLNRIFSNYAYPFNFYAANTYQDELITVQDIVSTVNILLETGVVVDTTDQSGLRSAFVNNYLFIANGKLMLNLEVPVSALDVSLKNIRDKQLGMLLNSNDFQTIARNTPDGVRFIMYSGSGKEIPAGLTELAQLSSDDAVIVNASLANKQAESVPVIISEIPTDWPNERLPGIQAYLNQQSVTILLRNPVECVTVQVFNLQGVLINQQERNQLTIGTHTIEYANTLSSGAYLLKLVFRTGDSVLTKNYKWIVSK